MIEIIKPGTKEKISCNSCGCLFSYEKEIKYITCPQCNEKIELEATR